MAWDEFFADLTDEQVGQVWARSMRELRDRDLIRSWNNPVADYAERLVAEELQLELAPPVAQDMTPSTPRDVGTRSRRVASRRRTRADSSESFGSSSRRSSTT